LSKTTLRFSKTLRFSLVASVAILDKNGPSGGNIGFLDGHVDWRKFLGAKSTTTQSNILGRDYIIKMYNTPDGRTQFWY
jgi:prepilin-type processing-associated H-X9-DG protein